MFCVNSLELEWNGAYNPWKTIDTRDEKIIICSSSREGTFELEMLEDIPQFRIGALSPKDHLDSIDVGMVAQRQMDEKILPAVEGTKKELFSIPMKTQFGRSIYGHHTSHRRRRKVTNY